MAFSNLSDKLGSVFKKLRGKGRLTESDVKEAMREVRLALLEADVNYKVAKQFTSDITEKCIGANLWKVLQRRRWLLKLLKKNLQPLWAVNRHGLKPLQKYQPLL